MFVRCVAADAIHPQGREHLAQARESIRHAKRGIAEEVRRAGQWRWDTATSQMELSWALAQATRGQYGIPADASNAFFKAMELYNLIGPFLRSHTGRLRMFDNASLPGDFIRAMCWWLTYRAAGQTLDWRANSLVGGLDDRFGLVRDHPERWMMRGHSGDVADPRVGPHIESALADWRADIYTSDLGMAVRDVMCEEEEHEPAHAGQCELMRRVLRPGGAAIVKTFTLSTDASVRELTRWIDMFDTAWVVKPQSSKSDNSECYWIGVGYREAATVREPQCTRSMVAAAEDLARRQTQKIAQNIRDFRTRVRPLGRFQNAVLTWCELHIGANIPWDAAIPYLPTAQ